MAPQAFARAAAGFLNSMGVYERFLACVSSEERRRGLAMKARAIVAHDRLLAGRLPRGGRA
jgi:hypothetical protein